MLPALDEFGIQVPAVGQGFSPIRPAQCLQPYLHQGMGWIEDCIYHAGWTLQVFGYGLWWSSRNSDDILIFSSSQEKRVVLQHQLYVKVSISHHHNFISGICGVSGKPSYGSCKSWGCCEVVPPHINLQGAVGFDNFFHQFVQNFSFLVAPLSALLKKPQRRFTSFANVQTLSSTNNLTYIPRFTVNTIIC